MSAKIGDPIATHGPSQISHVTSETSPSGTIITTLHLTDEAKCGLSTNGARIPPNDYPAEHDRVAEAIWVYSSASLGAGMLGLFTAGHLGAAIGLALGMIVSALTWRSRRRPKQ